MVTEHIWCVCARVSVCITYPVSTVVCRTLGVSSVPGGQW